MRPRILTKIFGKGDVRSFKVLPLSLGRHQLLCSTCWPQSRIFWFQEMTVFLPFCSDCNALRGGCDLYVRFFAQLVGTMRHKSKWVTAEWGRTLSITFSLCFGPRHTVSWASPLKSWLFYVCQWLHYPSSLETVCKGAWPALALPISPDKQLDSSVFPELLLSFLVNWKWWELWNTCMHACQGGSCFQGDGSCSCTRAIEELISTQRGLPLTKQQCHFLSCSSPRSVPACPCLISANERVLQSVLSLCQRGPAPFLVHVLPWVGLWLRWAMLLQAVVGSFCPTAFASQVSEPLAAACPVPRQPEQGQAGHSDNSPSSRTASSAADQCFSAWTSLKLEPGAVCFNCHCVTCQKHPKLILSSSKSKNLTKRSDMLHCFTQEI